MLNEQINCHKGACSNYTRTVWNKAVFSNCLKSLRDKSRTPGCTDEPNPNPN